MIRVAATNLGLRRFENTDIERLYQFRNDPVFQRQLVGTSFGYSTQDLANWIEYHRTVSNEELWAIVDATNDMCVGQVGLYQIDNRNRRAEFGIGIGFAEYQGSGNGTAVTRTVLELAFREMNLNKVTLTVNCDNHRAIAVYTKLGFYKEGIFRQEVWRDNNYLDVLFMSLLSEEWKKGEGLSHDYVDKPG